MLSQQQIKDFKTNGCIVVPQFVDPHVVQQLLSRSKTLISEFDITTHPLTQFTTDDKDHVGDEYFLNSADNVSFFFEPESIVNGVLVKPQSLAINKIGHGLHLQEELFNKVTINDTVHEIVKQLGFKNARALQSMVICKQPEIGGAVPSHQDGVFLYTNPPSAVGFWIALEDATLENGCLSFAPGSHKRFPLKKRFVRKNDGTGFIDINTDLASPDESTETWVPVQVKAGDLVLIHNAVLHKSESNTSGKSRFAYTFHVIENDFEYDKLNWLQSDIVSIV